MNQLARMPHPMEPPPSPGRRRRPARSGSFGVLDSGRADVSYEPFRGHRLDRAMLDVSAMGGVTVLTLIVIFSVGLLIALAIGALVIWGALALLR